MREVLFWFCVGGTLLNAAFVIENPSNPFAEVFLFAAACFMFGAYANLRSAENE